MRIELKKTVENIEEDLDEEDKEAGVGPTITRYEIVIVPENDEDRPLRVGPAHRLIEHGPEGVAPPDRLRRCLSVRSPAIARSRS